MKKTLLTVLSVLALTGATAQAAAPSLSYEVNGNELVITYTGTLYKSSDAVTWAQVASASNPYKVALDDKKQFFCAKGEEDPGKNITVPLSDTVDLDMIWVEPGTFLMGSPEDELGRYSFEIQREVTLSYGYWLSKYEVTQEQYKAVMGYNHSTRVGVNHPVESVTWEMAMKFCARLTAIEREAGRLPQGYVYSLPTEAQWEYACRAGTTTALNSGKNLSDKDKCPEMDEVGWYKYNSGEYDADGKYTNKGNHYPVGQKLPNAWGFYDMHGNVAEWCLDKSAKDYPNTAVTDPLSFVGTTSYVVRGGKWTDSSAMQCRSASRQGIGDNYSQKDVGFRVALIKDMLIPLSDNVNLDMTWIEPGTFIMGSPTDELGRYDNEVQHEVTLTQGYWMGRYEITQAQYKAVMKTNPSYFKDYEVESSLPVEQVNWNDAKEFCAKLTEIEKAAGRLPEGYEYTLPTEAQWEYACRAGTTTALNNGKNLSDAKQCPEMDEVGWYWYNSEINGRRVTHPVGQKLPNAWGLYDMHGNVNEWCLDWYGDYPTSAVTDPIGAVTGWSRVIRSGSWNNNANNCSSAFRSYTAPDNRSGGIGFRVALVKSKNITIPLSDKVDLDMIWINPGTFTMGSPTDELGRDADETLHEVTLTQGYWIGKYEVTQAQYEAVMDSSNPSGFKGADLPVETISWDDATNFCAKLNAQEKAAGRLPQGYEYTLPTEAQWEYACRAGTTTALNSGKDLSDKEQCPNVDKLGWYMYNSNDTTHPVGQKKPNAWGLYDMHGNVWEWCLDKKGDYPTTPVTDPVELVTGMDHARHGGCWQSNAAVCRSANRGYRSNSDKDTGFRVALVSKNITIPLSNTVDLDMIWIESGTFMMGSPADELGRDVDEFRHEVTLTQDYWIGKYEVTQAQYEAVMDSNPSEFKGTDLPVDHVSRDDAMAFCEKLTASERMAGRLPEGYEYTLPTEAQWEYACRAGTTTALNSGKNLSDKWVCPEMDEVGWYLFNSEIDDRRVTHPVGQKLPNAWGLYDMHGNVWEWCLDWYEKDYPTSAVTDPTGPKTGVHHIYRGGFYSTSADSCRSAYRCYDFSYSTGEYYGFRVVLVPVK